MPIPSVAFRSALVLLPSPSFESQLLNLAEREGFPKSPYDIESDLADLAAAGGMPATLSEPLPGKGSWSLLLHTSRYWIRLFETQHGDAHRIASIAPMRLRDHQRLARGYLRVKPGGVLVVASLNEIPRGTDSGLDAIFDGWGRLTASLAKIDRPTESQDAFLDTLGDVIDATERITTASEGGDGYPYREVKPTGGARSGSAQAYEFTLAGGRAPDEKAFVQVASRAEGGAGAVRARGQVTRVNGMTVTIKFDEAVDWNDLRGQGEIATTSSTVVFRMQREALSQLRTGQAQNPGILGALIDGRVGAPRTGGSSVGPPRREFPLNTRQREAFDKALAGPDLLVVIGPPGTGKTTTITDMVRAAAARGERVIVCSQNNRAVDNVLGELPKDLVAVRVGNELSITADGRPYLLQRQATDVRDQAVVKAHASLEAYSDLEDATGWADELVRRNAALVSARSSEAEALSGLDSARRTAGGQAAEEVDRLTDARAMLESKARRYAARAARLERLSERTVAWSTWAIIGWLFGLLSRRWSRQSGTCGDQASALGAAIGEAAADLTAARRHLIEITKDVPAVMTAKAAADDSQTQASDAHTAALHAARSALDAVPSAGLAPPPLRSGDGGRQTDTELAAAEEWLTQWLPRLAARRDLLAQWADKAAGDSRQFHTELLRYADVLAATCTGAGSRPELADLNFDLAIVDEAGQIGVADALIPLARARRAVLVGDHIQLPPFLDNEVDAWGSLVGDPLVRNMLTKSALELVVGALPEGSPNVVWLTEQRRMPEVIAEFVSAQFYGGRLETPQGLREHQDDLFRSPLAFIDTSGLDWRQRRDRSGRGGRGYDNPGEARMLADLAVHYDQAHRDWAVIVPYLSQAELIQRQLTGRVGDPDKVKLNVGTVDSFQGGQRDVILYGFTRSNPERNIGFLRELRRVNVAITRVMMQLVLVGDLETLTKAKDSGFRELARSLQDYYAAGSGEIVPHDDARGRLRARGRTS
jgi:hypothetical protein